MLTQPILEIYRSLRPQQKHYIRMVLWDRYRYNLVEYLQAEGSAAPDHIGHSFVASGSDPDGLLVQATELARQDNCDSIQGLCLAILQEQLDKTKQELAVWTNDEDKGNEGAFDWERDRLSAMSETMIIIFPGLRPIIAEFGLQGQQEGQHKEFIQRERKPGREPLH